MPNATPSPRQARPTPGLHVIRSPLSRVAYGLAAGAAHLLFLQYGTVHLRKVGSEVSPDYVGPRILWWADGERRELLAEVGTRGTLLSLPDVTLLQALPTNPIGDQMRRTLAQDLDLSGDAHTALARPLEGFTTERNSGEPGADIAASNYLTLLLLQLWRFARKDIVNLGGAPQGLSERFIVLAAQRFREHRAVEDYAAELRISRDRLGSAVKRATGLSPRAYLHRLLLRDAMELLANTGMPISQVAFRLGFADAAYFTRFFKRETGQNPGAFRRSYDRNANSETTSFAAWP